MKTEFPTPFCKVFKEGKLIRWEDADGNRLPPELWPQSSVPTSLDQTPAPREISIGPALVTQVEDKAPTKPIELVGFGYISKTGRWYCRRPGRGQTGEYRHCKLCGKEIWVKGYRIKQGLGNLCRNCSKKAQATSVRFALMGLAAHASRYTPSEILERTANIVAKYLEKDAERTVVELVDSRTFSTGDLLWNGFSIVLEQSLRLDPSFEEAGEGFWKLKADGVAGDLVVPLMRDGKEVKIERNGGKR